MRDILVYQALKNVDYHFNNIKEGLGEKIEDVIPEFFKIRASGVHVVIVCTDNRQPSTDDFIQLFRRGEQNADRNIVPLQEREDKACCQCAVYSIRSLLDIYDCIFSAIKAGNLLDYCSIEDLNEIFSVNEKMNYQRKFSTMFNNIDVANALSLTFQEDKKHTLPELRLMLILPSEQFGQFEIGMFASILEYVVLEMPLDPDKLIHIIRDQVVENKKMQIQMDEIYQEIKQHKELSIKYRKRIEIYVQKEETTDNYSHINYNKIAEKIMEEFIDENDRVMEKISKIIEEHKKFEKPISKISRNNTYVRSEKNKNREETYSKGLEENSEKNGLEGYNIEEKTQIKGRDKESAELLNEKSIEIQRREDNAMSDMRKEDKER